MWLDIAIFQWRPQIASFIEWTAQTIYDRNWFQ